MSFFRASDIKESVQKRLDTGFQKGATSGFRSCDDIISFLEGYTTVIIGAAHSGKSQLAQEWLVYHSRKLEHKNFMYVPEGGSAEDAIADLIQIYLKKNLKAGNYELTIKEIEDCFAFLDKFFIFADPTKRVTIKELYRIIHENKAKIGKINTLLVDHFGWLKRDDAESRMMLNEYVCEYSQTTYLSSKKLGLHTITINHITNIGTKETKDGVRYTPQPHIRDAKGGLEWDNNAYQAISVWRPSRGVLDPDGYEYESNVAIIKVDKSKPKFVGRMAEFKLFFDVEKQCYYEPATGEGRLYIGEWENESFKKPLTPNVEYWNEPTEIPF